jgi:sortase A
MPISGRNSPRDDARPRRRSSKAVRLGERLLLSGGFLLLAICTTAYIHRAVMFRAAMKSFEHARATNNVNESKPAATLSSEETMAPAAAEGPSRSHDTRVSNAPSRADKVAEVPLAILRIPKIQLEVPVLHGTDEITLNRGVGQIAGTAAPGEKGNIGIAGHRDGFFRNLKEISRGDVIEIETTSASEIYVVDHILVTGPDDVSVLQSRDTQSLTLVTCYPFHFIGPAPRRFVVEATLKK